MNLIEEIRRRLDIVEVVSWYLRLERTGKNYRALCPFHPETKPSFFVSPERQRWHCFGCGAGGDIFTFVMRKENISFREALELLARKAGIELSERRAFRRDPEREDLYRANELAAQFYHHALLNSSEAAPAREYLEKRSVSSKSIEDFLLGYAPKERGLLSTFLLSKGFKRELLVRGGLLTESGGERFAGRLIFPIRDPQGRVIGFGARALDDSHPKYVNSPQTPLFDKSSVLFGFDRAREAIRREGRAVIVEGYMDVIIAHQYGERTVVASLGTSITEKQLSLLGNITSRVVLALDPDAAGDAAVLRGIEICRRALEREELEMPDWMGASSRLKAEILIASLPEGKDPDELIKEDVGAWRALIDGAQPLVDFSFSVAERNFDLSRAEGRRRARDYLLPIIAEIPDPGERELCLRRLSKLTGYSEKVLAGIAAKLQRSEGERRRKAEEELSPSGDPLEEFCLSLLLRYPELRGRISELSPEHFQQAENREIFKKISEGGSVEDLPPELREHAEEITRRFPTEVNPERELEECALRLEERRLRNEAFFLLSSRSPEELEGFMEKKREIDAKLLKIRERRGLRR